MKFKQIKATYKTTGRNNEPVELIIERTPSGAFKYGDRSSHAMYINGNWYKGYDTRYDRIPTDKENWLKEVMQYIIKPDYLGNSNHLIELVSYEEKEVEIED